MVLGPEQIISPEHLPGEFRENQMSRRAELSSYGDAGLKTILGSIERQLLRDALEKFPTAAEAADYLKIDPSTLAKKRKRYGL